MWVKLEENLESGYKKYRTEVEAKITRTFTRSQRVSSLSEHNKSALADHTAQQKHMINWSKAMVIDREQVQFYRWIKEAVHITTTYPQGRPTRYESGRGQLSTHYAYDRFLDTASSSHVKNRKN